MYLTNMYMSKLKKNQQCLHLLLVYIIFIIVYG